VTECPLCKDHVGGAAKFCGACYERAGEAVARGDSSTSASERAVQVALTYLGPLYEGVRPPEVTKEAELVCLAVTAAYDVRNHREKIAGLEAELLQLQQCQLNPAVRELDELIKTQE
jgi:hypothetical protein